MSYQLGHYIYEPLSHYVWPLAYNINKLLVRIFDHQIPSHKYANGNWGGGDQ